MSLVVGSARIDESGHISGGKRGINPGVLRPFKRLVLSEAEEHHSSKCHCGSYAAGMQKQQYRILPGAQKQCNRTAEKSRKARKDFYKNRGRLQFTRESVLHPGFDPGNFNTASEVSALKATGQFMEPIAVTSKTELFNGDVLVTKTKGHTVVVVSGNPRRGNAYYPKYEGASGSIITALAAVGEKDTSKAHRAKIAAANGITNYAYTAAQNTKMVNLLKKGKLIKA